MRKLQMGTYFGNLWNYNSKILFLGVEY